MNSLLNIKNIYLRFIFYIFIWQFYILFMSIYSPLGAEWLDCHTQIVNNHILFSKNNGYLSNYGFSIWSICSDLTNLELTNDKIYLSHTIFSSIPYILINELIGNNAFKNYGYLFNYLIIFTTGVLISEIIIKLSKENKNTNVYNFFRSILIFTFFTINPWTYKMILLHWVHIFFIFFFLLGILMFLMKKNKLGLVFFFISGCFDYQSSAALTFFYSIIIILIFYVKNDNFIRNFMPFLSEINNAKYKIIFSFSVPVIIYFFLRFLASTELNLYAGTSILERIGISGDDPFNGGILGALQFLGGNRITNCLMYSPTDINLMNLNQKMYFFYCSLSIMSMAIISIFSIVGLFYLAKNEKFLFNSVALPLVFIFLCYTFILQQSSSVHLKGYSYFFSVLFSIGITSLILEILKRFKFSITSILSLTPITFGIMLLCIRVSMLTGPHGN